MKKALFNFAFVAFVTLAINSCILDAKQDRQVIKPPKGEFLPLDTRDNVLNNLQAAYNQRNISQYDKLLDANFTFFFSPTDVQNGTVQFSQWDRAGEINATTNMFNPSFSPSQGAPISSIDLALSYPKGDNAWTPVQPLDAVTYPNETWYEKTVTYSMTIVAGPNQFISNNIDASFVVRQAEVNGETIWRIIAWRDDI
jgi:hypothetical protein